MSRSAGFTRWKTQSRLQTLPHRGNTADSKGRGTAGLAWAVVSLPIREGFRTGFKE